MSTHISFLHQNPLKFVFSGYFCTEYFTSNKRHLLKNVNALAFVRKCMVCMYDILMKKKEKIDVTFAADSGSVSML